ncbi:MAG: class I SAM-dependent methyltransferase, partial [Candidatus Latescibacteria bacterium]|nr:class I SAM-dependent methyltransferase [Candidatus Latescibacterota bacterium]
MDDLTDIRDRYNANWNAEETRLQRHQLEADITWRYLDLYLPPQGKLLEIGFGTGFYTFPLAKRGYQITAVDLADEYVTRCKTKAEQHNLSDQIDFQTGDARILDGVPRGKFDVVLLMGPLYHLVHETDRTAALQSAYDCLKPEGVIFSAMISRFGILGDLVKDNSSWIENPEEVESFVKNGHRPMHAPRGGFRGYFARLD